MLLYYNAPNKGYVVWPPRDTLYIDNFSCRQTFCAHTTLTSKSHLNSLGMRFMQTLVSHANMRNMILMRVTYSMPCNVKLDWCPKPLFYVFRWVNLIKTLVSKPSSLEFKAVIEEPRYITVCIVADGRCYI